ncbi:hypothetical protein NQ318_013309 [Aromia moschata]|uniref:UDP-glucuronosyltransferase n=1 Tax=Aromia moschata TaxID=1265417 RepID=A0AAV8XZH9_9CUCU|nr:hypothetical protein NQ318_013309 [Aromia moschata]
MIVISFLLFAIEVACVNSANILGIIPTASFSHQVPFHPLWREFDEGKGFLDIADTLARMMNEANEAQLSSPEIQNLIHNESLHFDLLMVEAQLPGMMAFSWRFKCPMIGIASLDASKHYHTVLGNPNHPVINPDVNLPVNDPEELTFKERISAFLYGIIYEYVFMYGKVYPGTHMQFKQYFGEDLPSFDDLLQNISMLFVNTNPIFQNVRALHPNTVAIGGTLHLKAPEPLPRELQEYLDNSTNGLIYFSLGGNVQGYLIADIFKDILAAFSELPYNFLIKSDLEMDDLPSNVRIGTWFPQQDIFRHPNVKLFISQGGLQSLQESVINGIPVIGIPFFGDQFSNVHKMMKKGYGIKLEKTKISKESMKSAILQIMNDSKYRETAKELSEILKDEEMSGLQKAVWWTEYVLRHKGASHWRSPTVGMPFWKFYLLDVICFIGFLTCVLPFCQLQSTKTSVKETKHIYFNFNRNLPIENYKIAKYIIFVNK